ncbi:unnamed protein product [Closterium sp. Naga37s-1]|nr:unnamed protein product [Closterium sp. Naga37s-1]
MSEDTSPSDSSLPDALRGAQRTSSGHVSSAKTNEAAESLAPRGKSGGNAEGEGGTAKMEQMTEEAEKEAEKGEDGGEEQSSGERKGPGEGQKEGEVSKKAGEGGSGGGKGGSGEGEWCEALGGEVWLVACKRPQLLARSEKGMGAVCVNIDDELVRATWRCSGWRCGTEKGRGGVCVNMDDELVREAVGGGGGGAWGVAGGWWGKGAGGWVVRSVCHVGHALWSVGRGWWVDGGGGCWLVAGGVYEPYCMDFGPLSLACIHRYCDTMDRALQEGRGLSRRVVHVCSSAPHKKANAALLLAAYLILRHAMPADAAHAVLHPLDPLPPFRDASNGACTFHITALDCCQVLVWGWKVWGARSVGQGVWGKECGARSVGQGVWGKECGARSVGQGVWGGMCGGGEVTSKTSQMSRPTALAPSISPLSTAARCVFGARSEGCKALERAQKGGLITGFRVGEYERLEQADLTTPADDPASVMEGYLTPEDYVQYFRQAGIAAIIRLNRRVYDKRRFTRHGFAFYDLYFPDGGAPSDGIVERFFAVVEGSNGPVAIHCKAGLGRTGVLVGCCLMKHCGMTATQVRGSGGVRAVGLVGSVIGQQQHYLALMHPRMARAVSPCLTSACDCSMSLPCTHAPLPPVRASLSHALFALSSSQGEEFRRKTRALSPFSPRTTTSTAPGNPPPVLPHAHAPSLALPSRTGRKVYARTDEQAAAAVADLQFSRHSRSLARTGSVPVRPGSAGPMRSGSAGPVRSGSSVSLRFPLGRSVSRPGSSSSGAESSMSGVGGGGGEGIGPKQRRQREGGGRERRAASAATTPRARGDGDGAEGAEEGGGSGEEGEKGGEGGEEGGGAGARESGAWVRLRRLGGSMRERALSLSSSPALRRPISKSASMSPYTSMPAMTPMTPHASVPASHESAALHPGMASPEPRHVRAARRLRLRGVWGAADGVRIGGNVWKEAGEGGGGGGEVRVGEGGCGGGDGKGGARCGEGECSAVEGNVAVQEAECVGEEGAGAADVTGEGRDRESRGASEQAAEDASALATRMDSAAQVAALLAAQAVPSETVASDQGAPEAAATAPDSERPQAAAVAAVAAERVGASRKTHSRAASWLGLSFFSAAARTYTPAGSASPLPSPLPARPPCSAAGAAGVEGAAERSEAEGAAEEPAAAAGGAEAAGLAPEDAGPRPGGPVTCDYTLADADLAPRFGRIQAAGVQGAGGEQAGARSSTVVRVINAGGQPRKAVSVAKFGAVQGGRFRLGVRR